MFLICCLKSLISVQEEYWDILFPELLICQCVLSQKHIYFLFYFSLKPEAQSLLHQDILPTVNVRTSVRMTEIPATTLNT